MSTIHEYKQCNERNPLFTKVISIQYSYTTGFVPIHLIDNIIYY